MRLFPVFTGVLLLAMPAMAQSTSRSSITPLDGPSIFSRVRGSSPIHPEGGESVPPAPIFSVPPRFVGTFQEQDHYVAFLELQSAGETKLLTLHEGDGIAWAGARIIEITPDSMVLGNGISASRTVPVGESIPHQTDNLPDSNPRTMPQARPTARPTGVQSAPAQWGGAVGTAPATVR